MFSCPGLRSSCPNYVARYTVDATELVTYMLRSHVPRTRTIWYRLWKVRLKHGSVLALPLDQVQLHTVDQRLPFHTLYTCSCNLVLEMR